MKKRGIGYACSAQGVNYHFGHEDSSNVELSVKIDNSLLIRTAASDLGQGLEAALIHIVSTSFNGFPVEKIAWEGSNSLSPAAGGTGASRQTTITGNALFRACENLKGLLCSIASEQLDCHPDKLEFRGEEIRVEEKSLPLPQLFEKAREQGIKLVVHGSFTAPMTTALSADGKGFPINQFGYVTQIAEVEVDTVTGEVTVIRIEAFHDSGTILNPIGAVSAGRRRLRDGHGFHAE